MLELRVKRERAMQSMDDVSSLQGGEIPACRFSLSAEGQLINHAK
jgi:hypothetical protein